MITGTNIGYYLLLGSIVMGFLVIFIDVKNLRMPTTDLGKIFKTNIMNNNESEEIAFLNINNTEDSTFMVFHWTQKYQNISQNMTTLNITSLHLSSYRRSQLFLAPIEDEFLSDVNLLKQQLEENNYISSPCKSIPSIQLFDKCYGLGTTLSRLNEIMARRMMWRQVRLVDVDNITCGWFQRDETKVCNTMFGDCYFPALTTGRHWNVSNSSTVGTCHVLRWFLHKYSFQVYAVAHFSWLMGVSNSTSSISSSLPSSVLEKDHDTKSCIALQIRRGDACINEGRVCFSYDTYFKAVEFFVDSYPSLTEILVVTDADDFPMTKFQQLGKKVVYTEEIDRQKYNVGHLKNFSIDVWTPENRDLRNATSELISEVSNAVNCQVFVGTLSSGVGKWILREMIALQGRIPPFYSLEGCLANLAQWRDYKNTNCEEPFM
jgi:hypothetical protein